MKKFITLLLALSSFFSVTRAQVPNYVPTNGLVAWYPFNGNANDESGNGNNGVVTGATLTSDRNNVANKAYHFNGNGTNNKIVVSAPNNLPLGNKSRTISVWLKTNSTYWGRMILIYGDGNAYTQISTNAIGGNINYFTAMGANTQPMQTINPNQWVNFISVFDSTTLTTTIYRNGILIYTQNNVSLNTIYGTMYIGIRPPSWPYNPGDDFIWLGELDDIGIWNRALTNCEIQALYSANANANNVSNITIFQQDTLSVCGSNTILSAPNNFSYNWSTNDTTQSINISQTGWYKCTISNAGCTQTDSVFVSLVNAQIQQNDTTILVGRV